MKGSTQNGDIRVAVITGGHAFDVPGFQALFNDTSGMDCYIQSIENFAADVGKVRTEYEVLLFYTMPRGLPSDAGRGPDRRIRAAMEDLGRTEQGIFILHHGILSYDEWPFWSEMVGIVDRNLESYHHDLAVRIDVADSDHPITQGLSSWEMIDETYVMNEPGPASRVILTCDHPNSMRAVGWTHTFGKSRVFCFQCGHDNRTYVDPSFRTVVARGVQWCAGGI